MAFDKMLTKDFQNLELLELIKLGEIIDSLYISPKKRGIFVVGGAIRDILTNSFPADLDLVVEDDPEDFAKKIAKKFKGRVVNPSSPYRIAKSRYPGPQPIFSSLQIFDCEPPAERQV